MLSSFKADVMIYEQKIKSRRYCQSYWKSRKSLLLSWSKSGTHFITYISKKFHLNNKVKQINFLFKLICQANGFTFINNNNIVTEDLRKDGLNRGKSTLANDFINNLNNFY